MLCRVFHRTNKELPTKSGLVVEQEKIGSSSTNVGSSPSPIHQTIPCNQQIISFSNSPPSTTLNLAVLHNSLEFPQEEDDALMIGMIARGGEEYGFLLDLDLEDQSLEFGVFPTIQTKTFFDNEKEKGFP